MIPFMFDGLGVAPSGIVAERLPVNHKYTSLFSGALVLTKLPLISELYALAAVRLGLILPL